MTELTPLLHRPFAGLAIRQIATAAFLLLNTLWGVWVTKALFELQRREVVAVSLNQLVSDFVVAESRRSASPEETTARTRVYLQALDRAVARLEGTGRIVLVKESVLGRRIPDQTSVIRTAVEKELATGETPQADPR